MNTAIALQRPSYQGKLNFDEQTYLGVIAFGNALGNSIVGHIQERENLKNLQDKISNIKIQGADDLNLTLPNLNNSQDYLNSLNKITPKEVAIKELAGLGGINVGAANVINADYQADLAIKTQQGQQTQLRVDQLVAESNQLLGNNTDVGLYGNSGAYGVPPLLALPDAPSLVGVSPESSFLRNYLDYSNQTVTPLGAAQLLPA